MALKCKHSATEIKSVFLSDSPEITLMNEDKQRMLTKDLCVNASCDDDERKFVVDNSLNIADDLCPIPTNPLKAMVGNDATCIQELNCEREKNDLELVPDISVSELKDPEKILSNMNGEVETRKDDHVTIPRNEIDHNILKNNVFDKRKESSVSCVLPVSLAQISEHRLYNSNNLDKSKKIQILVTASSEQSCDLDNWVDNVQTEDYLNSILLRQNYHKKMRLLNRLSKGSCGGELRNSFTDDNLVIKQKTYENSSGTARDNRLKIKHSRGLILPFLDLAVLKKTSGLRWNPSFSDKKQLKGDESSTVIETKAKDLLMYRRRKRAQIRPKAARLFQTCHSSLIRSQSMEDAVKKLSEGAYLWKIRGVNKYYNRQFKVDRESMSLVAESKKWWSPGGLTAVAIIEIAEIREGWKTDTFNKVSDYREKMVEKGTPVTTEPIIEESLCFSIIHGSTGREVLDLMANSKEQRDLWINGLKFLLESVQSLHQDRLYDVWLRKKFEAADKDKNGTLNMDEIYNLVTSLNLKLDKKHAKSLFNEANKSKLKRDGEQVLDAQEFVNFYHALLKMPEIEKIYARYVNPDSKVMGTKELLDFLRTENGLGDFQSNQATQLIQQFEASNLRENDNLSFDGFYHLLLSDLFDVFNNEHQQNIFQDMTQPLAHYYISSSHNTYLIGNQLAGESSVEGYISALKRGCRVVELDLWDGDEGEPIIYHGHTFTSKITLADVLRDAIKLYAFTASPYPVILSIENHLSIEQQVVMVRLIKEILGDYLFTDAAPSDIKILPSPEDLKHKIIIKAKKPQGVEVEDDDEDDDPDNIDYIDSDDGNSNSKKAKPHKPLTPELAQIVNVCEGKKFVSFASAFESDRCIHFPSLRENKAKSLFESSPEDFVKFTERQIAKIYPLGTRTDSSNLKPYPLWSVGAQVVTLNMQTEDKANFYNEALFRRNGNCGYVLKPDILIGKKPYNPKNPSPDLTRVVRVKVISAQHLPPSEKKNDVVDPYIQLKVRGHPDDKQKQRTKIVKNNGFNPVWTEVLEVKIRVPEVALIYFNVRDESSLAKDPVLALACIPFASLCTGYRHVHLTDITGKSLLPAALFVHVAISC